MKAKPKKDKTKRMLLKQKKPKAIKGKMNGNSGNTYS